jgi:transcriptional regulator with XRE-family HTH domain
MSKKKRLTPGQIARKRAEHGLSQAQLAKYLRQACGLKVTASLIHFIEGGYKPSEAISEAIYDRLTQTVPPEVAKAVKEKKERKKARAAAEKRRARREAREAKKEANQ